MKPWEKYQKIQNPPPWERYAKKTERTPYSALGSAGLGALEGATLGFADELGGVASGIHGALKGEGFKKPYQEGRDAIRQEMQFASEDNPDSHTAGQLAGAIGSVFIPGLGWMNASKGASILNAIGKGAIGGGLVGAGTSQADLTKGEIGDFGSDVAQGGIIGGAAGAGTRALGTISDPQALERIATQRGVKAVTGQNIGGIRKITGTTHKNPGDVTPTEQKLMKTGRDLIDEPNLMGWASTSGEMAPKLAQARQKYGKEIGFVADKIDQYAPNSVNPKNIASKIRDFSDSIPDTPRGKRLKNALQDEIDTYENMKPMSFKRANDYKQDYKFVNTDADALISNADAIKKIRSIISKEMEETADRLGNQNRLQLTQQRMQNGKLVNLPAPYIKELDNILAAYKHYKQKYGSFKNLSDAATDRYQKNLSNRMISPSDYAMGSAAGTAKAVASGGFDPASVAIGIGAGGLNNVLRQRGNSFISKAADKTAKMAGSISDNLSEVIKRNPRLLGKWATPLMNAAQRGPQSLAAANFILQQTQPEYRKLVNESAENEETEE